MTDIRRERELHTEDLAASAVPREDREIPERMVRRQYEEGPQPPGRVPLFSEEETESFRAEWNAIQTGFVDEPRRSVEDGDALVARLMKRLAEIFAEERSGLERQWDRGDQISTEDLRVALTRYRSFFDRLLTV